VRAVGHRRQRCLEVPGEFRTHVLGEKVGHCLLILLLH
jgi:hypothetical protein